MYYYTYKIILTQGTLKDKIYFGQHRTNNLNDGYKGSGKVLLDYYKKYPNGYIKEILGFYNSQEELDKAEYDLIHPHLNKDYCINQRDGGYKPNLGKKQKEKISKKLKKYFEDPDNRKNAGKHNIGRTAWNKGLPSKQKGICKSDETKKRMSESQKNKPKSEDHKNKISIALKGKQRSIESREKQSQTLIGHPSYIKGKHRVYDNKEKTKWHFEI